MTPLVWILVFALYLAFWSWYVGFRAKIRPDEVEATMQLVREQGFGTDKQRQALRRFLSEDDGRDFVMVNLLHLREPRSASREKLQTYQNIFLGQLLRKAGHPVFMARASSANLENLACEAADDWTAAAMVRYRSRRDLMEMLPGTVGSEHHGLKLAALDKTFAFPAGRWFMFGGPRLSVGLVLLCGALVAELLLA